nr:immunoglobulin heavy chain junction region [Mus musculus]
CASPYGQYYFDYW